ncbi:MAG: hypothetical protein ABSA02_21945 [Trebonia sp.]
MSAAASAVLGGVPAVVIAATTGGASATSDPTFGPLSPALAAQLSQNVDQPVIVVLKDQFGSANAGSTASGVRSAAVSASQTSLMSQLSEVHATGVKRFTLVNAVSATVSALEEQRLAASPAVAAVLPDARVTLPASALSPTAGIPAAATPARTVSKTLNNVAGACAAKGSSSLAPEGLALTSTVSQNKKVATARSLGLTGAGVKVAWIADGIDPNNVNFIKSNGKSVFSDYQDFSGDGRGAPTTGGEAFLDANTIAGQGTHVYNLNGFTNDTYKNGCYVRIEGVAPGASLVGLDVFAAEANRSYATTNSAIAEAIDYAVTRDHVNVINESFGENMFPDTTQDVIKLFDNAAIKAGVVVAVSSGDSGTTSTIGSPATDTAGVISAGASTQFQMYEQSNYGLARYFSTGWLSDNISGLSSSGYDEEGGTVDLVAPGDLSWASCDANTAKFADCTNLLGKASNIEISGGTSESSPFVAGAAALVIQAYRKTHGNSTPSPALVKQIILSTATDLGIPAQEQGAGLLNTYKAVELAESINRSKKTGSTLLESATQLTDQGLPGAKKSWTVTFTNTGSKRQNVTLHGRALGPDQNKQSGTVTLNDTTSNQVIDWSGFPNNYAEFKFTVKPGQSRLDVSIAYPGNPENLAEAVQLFLIDPKGRYAAASDPQGLGNYGNADVRTPVAGTWTAVVNDVVNSDDGTLIGGYNGAVHWQAVTEQYQGFGSVSSPSFSLPSGASKKVTYSVTAPPAPGDYAASLVANSNLGGQTSIPVVVRSDINVAAGGKFSGVLTGGNGRPGNVAQDNYYEFNVPAGTKAISAALALANDPAAATGGVIAGAYLVSPDGNVVGSAQNYTINSADEGISLPNLDATVLYPAKGTWTLIVNFQGPVPGSEVADSFTGTVSFATAGAESSALPDSTSTDLPAGVSDEIPVTITNTGSSTEDFYLDPRLSTRTTLTLAPVTYALGTGTNTLTIPGLDTATFPLYWVPSQSSSISVKQTSTIGAMTDLSPTNADPDAASSYLKSGSLCGRSVSVGYTAPGGDLTPGLWGSAPTECGPFAAAAKSGKATDKATVTTNAFDTTMTPSTGDLQQEALGAGAFAKVAANIIEVPAGGTATVDVTIKPTGKAGTVVKGTLYLDDVATGLPPYDVTYSSEVSALPYTYTIG